MKQTKCCRPTQGTLFSLEEQGVKSTPVRGCTSRSRVINYLKTREGLFRLVTSYPPSMPFTQAIEQSMVDFTHCSAPASLACHQRDARKEVFAND